MVRKYLSLLIFILFLFYNLYSQQDSAPSRHVNLGIDVLIQSKFDILKGKNIALLTNNTGRTWDCGLTVEEFEKTKVCTIKELFTPEHGFYTTIPAGKTVKNETLFNLPVYSLYGDNRRPSKEQLSKIDAVVVDIQDIGIRSYTYISTVFKVMDACAEYGKKIIILDRPNPLGGLVVDGNIVENDKLSFIGIAPIPYLHGLTIGEFATMVNEEGWLPKDSRGVPRKCDLQVVKMENWKRWMSWEYIGLQWFPTSPHIPTVDAIRGAAMLGPLGELGIISIGIGTTLPFQYVGSPDFKITAMNNEIQTGVLEGVKMIPAKYRPSYGMYSGKDCSGYLLRFPLNSKYEPYTAGIKFILAMRKLYPDLFKNLSHSSDGVSMFEKAVGSSELFESIINNAPDEKVLELARKGLDTYLQLRKKYLLYN